MATTYFNGFHTKTLLIPVPQGTNTIVLQKSNTLGLSDNLLIYGFIVRPHEETTLSYDNRPLVVETVFNNAFFSLHVKNKKNNNVDVVLDSIPLKEMVENGCRKITPVRSEDVDWSRSNIALNNTGETAVLNSGSVFELVVLYTHGGEENKPLVQNCVDFRTGYTSIPVNNVSKTLPINNAQQRYSLSNTPTFGMPQDALVLGFSLVQSQNILRGEPMAPSTVKSGYLSLQMDSNLFVEKFPLEFVDYKTLLPFELDYFPIIPIKAKELNWATSEVLLMRNSGIGANTVFQINLHWVYPSA
ncbi:MAG: hypothetical protein ACRBFS_24420 [Aureispira sp.]